MTKLELKLLLEKLEILKSEEIKELETRNFPDGTFYEKEGRYFHWENSELSESDTRIALLAKQTIYLRTIKNIVLFLFFLSIICICAVTLFVV